MIGVSEVIPSEGIINIYYRIEALTFGQEVSCSVISAAVPLRMFQQLELVWVSKALCQKKHEQCS